MFLGFRVGFRVVWAEIEALLGAGSIISRVQGLGLGERVQS